MTSRGSFASAFEAFERHSEVPQASNCTCDEDPMDFTFGVIVTLVVGFALFLGGMAGTRQTWWLLGEVCFNFRCSRFFDWHLGKLPRNKLSGALVA